MDTQCTLNEMPEKNRGKQFSFAACPAFRFTAHFTVHSTVLFASRFAGNRTSIRPVACEAGFPNLGETS